MADQLSRVFPALADPTRRDMVARLPSRRRDGGRAGRAVRREHAGGLQAPQGARGGRAGHAAAGTPSAGRSTSKRRCST